MHLRLSIVSRLQYQLPSKLSADMQSQVSDGGIPNCFSTFAVHRIWSTECPERVEWALAALDTYALWGTHRCAWAASDCSNVSL